MNSRGYGSTRIGGRIDGDGTFGGAHQGQDETDKRGLARPRLAEDGRAGARGEVVVGVAGFAVHKGRFVGGKGQALATENLGGYRDRYRHEGCFNAVDSHIFTNYILQN